MKSKARVRIFKYSNCPEKDRDKVIITIECATSHVRAVELEMTDSEFASCSLRGSEGIAEVEWRSLENVGKEWRILKLAMPKEHFEGIDRKRRICILDWYFRSYLNDGWSFVSDGLSSQQPGTKHKVCLGKHFTPEKLEASSEVGQSTGGGT